MTSKYPLDGREGHFEEGPSNTKAWKVQEGAAAMQDSGFALRPRNTIKYGGKRVPNCQ